MSPKSIGMLYFYFLHFDICMGLAYGGNDVFWCSTIDNTVPIYTFDGRPISLRIISIVQNK